MCQIARMVLSYKNIPYTTHWLIHPEIEPTLKSLGLPPNSAPGPGSPYTVPTLSLPAGNGGTCVMDSLAIARKLEELHPEPSLRLELGLHDKAAAAVGKAAFPLFPAFLPRVSRDVLVESTVPLVNAGREKRFGMTIDQLAAMYDEEKTWKAVEPGFGEMKALLTEHKRDDGPFILGSQVSYGDFVMVALFEGLRRIGEDLWEKVVGWDESFKHVYEACKPYMEKDD